MFVIHRLDPNLFTKNLNQNCNQNSSTSLIYERTPIG